MNETVKVVDDVEVQDVQEEDDAENNSNEMTENTPEARVKVYSYIQVQV